MGNRHRHIDIPFADFSSSPASSPAPTAFDNAFAAISNSDTSTVSVIDNAFAATSVSNNAFAAVPVSDNAFAAVPVSDNAFAAIPVSDTSTVSVIDNAFAAVPVSDNTFAAISNSDTSTVSVIDNAFTATSVSDNAFAAVPVSDNAFAAIPVSDTSTVPVSDSAFAATSVSDNAFNAVSVIDNAFTATSVSGYGMTRRSYLIDPKVVLRKRRMLVQEVKQGDASLCVCCSEYNCFEGRDYCLKGCICDCYTRWEGRTSGLKKGDTGKDGMMERPEWDLNMPVDHANSENFCQRFVGHMDGTVDVYPLCLQHGCTICGLLQISNCQWRKDGTIHRKDRTILKPWVPWQRQLIWVKEFERGVVALLLGGGTTSTTQGANFIGESLDENDEAFGGSIGFPTERRPSSVQRQID